MAAHRRIRFVSGIVAWMVATVLALALLDAFSIDVFFALSLLGLLVVTELTASFTVAPTWRRRLRWPVLLGLAAFAVVVGRRIAEILPPELVPT